MSARVFAFALTLAALAFSPRVIAAEPGAPEDVLREFYVWYVDALVRDQDPLDDDVAKLGRYVTARFLKEIETERDEESLNADPFLEAQDFDQDWAKNVNVSAPDLNGETATATVELQGKEMGTHKLRVSLRREEGAWKIDSVEAL